jgi:hypothetical protein
VIERGRKLLIINIALVLTISVATIAFYASNVGTGRLPTQVVRLLITIGLCWGLYRGSKVARYLMAVLLSLGFALALVGLPAVLRSGNAGGILIVGSMVAAYFFVAATLFWSSSIVAFQNHQKDKSAVSLSVTG